MNNRDYFLNIEKLCFKDLFNNNDKLEDCLLNLNDYIDNKINKENNYYKGDNGVYVEGKCIVGENTKIYPNTTILGPCIIGSCVEIMPGALIRPYSIIGDNVVISHATEIKHSIVMNNAKIGSFCFVGDSIIGYKSRIGSGTVLANRRFDQQEVYIKKDNENIYLKQSFFGSIVGDYARLGAMVTTYPGTFVGHHTWIYPKTLVKGIIPSLKKISNDRITDNVYYDLKD